MTQPSMPHLWLDPDDASGVEIMRNFIHAQRALAEHRAQRLGFEIRTTTTEDADGWSVQVEAWHRATQRRTLAQVAVLPRAGFPYPALGQDLATADGILAICLELLARHGHANPRAAWN